PPTLRLLTGGCCDTLDTLPTAESGRALRGSMANSRVFFMMMSSTSMTSTSGVTLMSALRDCLDPRSIAIGVSPACDLDTAEQKPGPRDERSPSYRQFKCAAVRGIASGSVFRR